MASARILNGGWHVEEAIVDVQALGRWAQVCVPKSVGTPTTRDHVDFYSLPTTLSSSFPLHRLRAFVTPRHTPTKFFLVSGLSLNSRPRPGLQMQTLCSTGSIPTQPACQLQRVSI